MNAVPLGNQKALRDERRQISYRYAGSGASKEITLTDETFWLMEGDNGGNVFYAQKKM